MISIEQCRAARGLLGWTQQDLADACGLSKTAINNYEKRHSDIKTESLRAIQQAFEVGGLEFSDNDGIRRHKENNELFIGENAPGRLIEDIINALADTEKTIMIYNLGEKFIDNLPEYTLEKYKDFIANNKVQESVTLRNDTSQALSLNDKKRKLPESPLSENITTFIYAKKVAFYLESRNMVAIVNNKDVVEKERLNFELFWEKSTPIFQNKSSAQSA